MVYVDDHIESFDLDQGLLDVSAQRRDQALHFRFELGRRQCVAAYLLLKRALRREYGLTGNPLFGYGPHGKPFIVGHPEIHFNLSHCRQAVVCAVSNRPVGIDVESVRGFKADLVSYTMNDREQRLIAEAEHPEVAFIRLWTMKEAQLKLTGEGINDHLKDVLDSRLRFTTVERLDKGYIYTVCEEGLSGEKCE